MRDDDGRWVAPGDTIYFTYGIPPRTVIAPVILRGNSLIAITAGHNPPEANLRSLRKYGCSWFKTTAQSPP